MDPFLSPGCFKVRVASNNITAANIALGREKLRIQNSRAQACAYHLSHSSPALQDQNGKTGAFGSSPLSS